MAGEQAKGPVKKALKLPVDWVDFELSFSRQGGTTGGTPLQKRTKQP